MKGSTKEVSPKEYLGKLRKFVKDYEREIVILLAILSIVFGFLG